LHGPDPWSMVYGFREIRERTKAIICIRKAVLPLDNTAVDGKILGSFEFRDPRLTSGVYLGIRGPIEQVHNVSSQIIAFI
jgi:hypothetical protein